MLATTPAPIAMSRFTWMPESRALVAEASSLPGRGRFHRLYDDACDVGIAIRSSHTGRVVIFALHSVERDSEGDTMWWNLRALNGTLTRHGMCSSSVCATVRIFND